MNKAQVTREKEENERLKFKSKSKKSVNLSVSSLSIGMNSNLGIYSNLNNIMGLSNSDDSNLNNELDSKERMTAKIIFLNRVVNIQNYLLTNI